MDLKNGNNFCVETKGVCFFCFHERPQSPNNCNPEPENSHHTPTHNISLRRLSKYLNVNFQQVFKLNIPLQYMNIGTSDVIVPLCGECATVTSKFSKLHHELEMVKMHLHSCVHAIRTKMEKADSDQDVAANYRKKWIMNNPIDAIQAEIVNNLRKETKAKCLSKLTRIPPKVTVKRLSLQNGSSRKRASERPCLAEGNASKQLSSRISIPEKSSNQQLSTSSKQPIFVTKEIANKNSLHQSSASANVLTSHIAQTQPNVPRNSILSMSVATVASTNTSTSSTMVPPVQHQPLNRTSNFAFPSHQPQPSQVYVCSTSSFTSSLHTVPATDTNSTQKSQIPVSSKRIEKLPPRLPNQSLFDCVHCEEMFEDKSTLRTHVVRSHCEQFFTTLKDHSLSSEDFKSIVHQLFKNIAKSHTVSVVGSNSKTTYSCPHCSIRHESDGDVYAHMFRFHYTDLTTKLLALQKEIISLRGGTTTSKTVITNPVVKRKEPLAVTHIGHTQDNYNDNTVLCNSCGMRYASKRTLAFHQKYNCKFKNQHKETVNPVREMPISIASTSTPTVTVQAPSTTCPSTSAEKFACPHCPKTFPFYYDHRVHLLTAHRTEEFSKYASNGVTIEQVNTELKRILQTYRKLPGNDYAGGCLFCTQVFSQVIELHNHILVGHFDVVVFKLRGLLPLPQQHNNAICIDDNDINNTAEEGLDQSTYSPFIQEESESVSMQVKADTTSSAYDTVEIIMQEDPLSLDLVELDSEYSDAVLCQEEEQLKMEWLFSFMDEDEASTQTAAHSINTGDEMKGFLLENSDSEMILP